MNRSDELAMSVRIDIVADLNAQDDAGLGWSTLGSAVDPAWFVPERFLWRETRKRVQRYELSPSMTMGKSISRSCPAPSARIAR